MPPQSSPDTRKWRRRASARPDEILRAALLEFSERGFDGVRMEDVARRAGLSKGGVYLYFKSKEALLRALIQERTTPIIDNALAAGLARSDDPKTALRTFFIAILEQFRVPENFATPRVVLMAAPRFPEIASFYRTEVVDRGVKTVEALVVGGIERGVFRKVDPRAAAHVLIGSMLIAALWQHVLGGESMMDDPAAFADARLDIFFEGLIATG